METEKMEKIVGDQTDVKFQKNVNYNVLIGLTALLFYIDFISCKGKVLILFLSWVASGGGYTLYLMYHTLGRDLRLTARGVPILLNVLKMKRSQQTVAKMFRRNLPEHSNKTMFFNESQKITYREVEEMSNRVANLFLKMKYKKGDTVALFMENRLEYIPIWLGLSKVGVIPALINYNLRNDSLLHCIRVANSRAVICSSELLPAIMSVEEELSSEEEFKIFCYDDAFKNKDANIIDLKKEMSNVSSGPEPKDIADSIKTTDPLLYIYTSGTTGLPKAVIIKHLRQLFVMEASHKAIGLTSSDIIYSHLPLYHSSGGQISTASAILYGTTTFIKKKFSASAFWKDCVKYNITATQYIGEICRYLLASPACPQEKQHKVRRMFGNGLRPGVWKEFVTRFNIKNISEFYGATEGNTSMVNNENKVGAVGFVGVIEPVWLQELLLPVRLIKVDPVTGDPIRDANGFCIKCIPGEAGECVGKIVKGDPLKEFNGYKSAKETNKKILCDVVKHGDRYFRSGDILVQDEFGWMYFKDRAGDTFRWKGENVSTAEVEVAVSKALGGPATVAYGAQLPGFEGRAGMVCIQGNPEDYELEQALLKLSNQLPGYAIPLFYRFSTNLDMTGTYKLKKTKLQEEGIDISRIQDNILFLDSKNNKFLTLDQGVVDDINNGAIRL